MSGQEQKSISRFSDTYFSEKSCFRLLYKACIWGNFGLVYHASPMVYPVRGRIFYVERVVYCTVPDWSVGRCRGGNDTMFQRSSYQLFEQRERGRIK